MTHARFFVVILAVACGIAAPARAAHRAPLRRATARAHAARPTGPPVTLQLAGLQIHVPIARNAVIHALARDAWPSLVRCVTPPPRARGHVAVVLHEGEHTVTVETSGAPMRRDPTLAACVQSALQRITLPPYDAERPETSVAFDLLFGLPALGVPQRGAHR